MEAEGRARRLPGDGQGTDVSPTAGLVFPSPQGRAFHRSSLNRLLGGLGIDAVPHGFRSSFRE